MIRRQAQFFQRSIENIGIVGTDPIFDYLIRRTQMQDMLYFVAALEAYRTNPRLEALTIKTLFDRV